MLYLLYIGIKEQIGNVKKMMLLLILPIIATGFILAGVAASDRNEDKRGLIEIGLHLPVDSIYATMLKKSFFGTDGFSELVDIDTVDNAEMLDYLAEGEVVYDGIIDVPPDFFDALMYFRHSPIQVYIETDDLTISYLMKGVMDSYGNYIKSVEASVISLYDVMSAGGFEQEIRYDYNERIVIKLVRMLLSRDDIIETVIVGDFSDVSALSYTWTSLMVMAVWTISLVVGVRWLDDQHMITLKRYISTGKSLSTYMTAFYLSGAVVIFFLMYCWCLVSDKFFGIEISGIMLLFCFLMICVDFSVVLLVAVLFGEKNKVILMHMVLGLVYSIAGGVVIPAYEMAPLMLVLGKLTPYYWMIRIMTDGISGMGRLEFWVVVGVMIGSISILNGITNVYARKMLTR